jgi:hypothetical protein
MDGRESEERITGGPELTAAEWWPSEVGEVKISRILICVMRSIVLDFNVLLTVHYSDVIT